MANLVEKLKTLKQGKEAFANTLFQKGFIADIAQPISAYPAAVEGAFPEEKVFDCEIILDDNYEVKYKFKDINYFNENILGKLEANFLGKVILNPGEAINIKLNPNLTSLSLSSFNSADFGINEIDLSSSTINNQGVTLHELLRNAKTIPTLLKFPKMKVQGNFDMDVPEFMETEREMVVDLSQLDFSLLTGLRNFSCPAAEIIFPDTFNSNTPIEISDLITKGTKKIVIPKSALLSEFPGTKSDYSYSGGWYWKYQKDASLMKLESVVCEATFTPGAICRLPLCPKETADHQKVILDFSKAVFPTYPDCLSSFSFEGFGDNPEVAGDYFADVDLRLPTGKIPVKKFEIPVKMNDANINNQLEKALTMFDGRPLEKFPKLTIAATSTLNTELSAEILIDFKPLGNPNFTTEDIHPTNGQGYIERAIVSLSGFTAEKYPNLSCKIDISNFNMAQYKLDGFTPFIGINIPTTVIWPENFCEATTLIYLDFNLWLKDNPGIDETSIHDFVKKAADRTILPYYNRGAKSNVYFGLSLTGQKKSDWLSTEEKQILTNKGWTIAD